MLDIKFFLKFSSCTVVVNIRNFYSFNKKFGIFSVVCAKLFCYWHDPFIITSIFFILFFLLFFFMRIVYTS